MFKALLKKQLMESFSFITQKKDGEKRSLLSTVGFALLLLFGVGSLGFSMWLICDALCTPLATQGFGATYLAFASILAFAFGIIGTVFTAKIKLYEAKDNDMLLAMPIPSWLILFSRMIGLYLFTLLFEGIVFVPATLCYFVKVDCTLPMVIGSLLSLLIMPLATLAICSVLGWLLALAEAKLPVKNLFAYIFSIGLFVGIMILETKLDDYLLLLATNGEGATLTMKKYLYPFYEVGRACAGNWLSLLISAGIFIGIFALVYFVLSKTYLGIATANKGSKKSKFKAKGYKQGTVVGTLLNKEFKRYFNNPMVVLNCFLGSIFCLVLPFLLLFGGDLVGTLQGQSGLEELMALLFLMMILALSSMDMVASSSISLEGENIWILHTLPVSTETVFFAKGLFHFITQAIPALFATVFLAILFKVGVGLAICMCLTTVVYCIFSACVGLSINLKLPNLSWTSELVPIKQGFSSLIASFGSMAVIGLLVGGWFWFGKYLPAWGYMLTCSFLLAGISGLLCLWLSKGGKKIFEKL